MISTQHKAYLPHILLVLAFVTESLSAQLTYFYGHSYGLSFILKSLVFAYMFSVSFKYYQKIYAWLGGLFLLFILSQFTFPQFEFDILKNFHSFINYIYPFVLIMGLTKLVNARNAVQLQKILQIGLLVLLGSAVVGAIFNWPNFATYYYRFGFKGLMPSPATATYIIILSWIVFLNENWKTKASNYIYVMLLAVSILVGTKANLLFLAVVLGHTLWHYKLSFSIQKMGFGIFGLICFFALLFTVFKEKFDYTIQNFMSLYTNEGLISALSSFRSRKFVENIAYYAENWNLLNYLVGGRHVFIDNFELDLFDVLLHFGLIGSFIYIFVAKKVLMPVLPKHQYSLFVGMLIIAALAGQLFYNTYVALLLAYYLLVQQQLQKKVHL